MNGNNWHPVLGGISSNTTVKASSIWKTMVWIGGLTFAGIPAVVAVGTAVEYIEKSSDVPLFVPALCIAISASVVYGTGKVANMGNKKSKKKQLAR
jgi:hypothetical protein